MVTIRDLVKRLLPADSFARNASLLAGGTALAQALALLAAPILTRLYRAEDFGYLQVYLSVMMFATVAVTLRLEQAIFLPKDEKTAGNVFCVTLILVFGISALSVCAIWVVNYYLTSLPLRSYFWLMPLAICGAGIYQCLSTWALRQQGYLRVSGTKVTQVGSQLAAQISLGILHSTSLGLLIGDAIGRFSGSINLAKFAWERSSSTLRSVRCRTLWAAAVRYRRFPLVSGGAAMIGVAATALPALLLAKLYGARSLGWFALADRILGAPTTLIGQAISQVYSVDAAALNASDPTKLHSLFLKLAKRLAIAGLIPLILLAVFAPTAFSLIFGGQWRESGEYARILALMHYIAFIAWPLAPTLNLLEQQVWQLAWDVGRLTLTVSSICLVHALGGSARVAIVSFAGTMLLGYIAHLFLSHFAIAARRRNHTSEQHCIIEASPYVEA